MQKAVKKSFHTAFWDVLRSELNETPPQYDMALSLLEEIKEVIFLFFLLYIKYYIYI